MTQTESANIIAAERRAQLRALVEGDFAALNVTNPGRDAV